MILVGLILLRVIVLRFVHAAFHSLSLLSGIPLYGYNTICLSIHPLMFIWIVSRFGLLQSSCYGQFYSSLSVDMCFHIAWKKMKGNGMTESDGRSMFIFLKRVQYFMLPLPAMYETSSGSISNI